MRLDGSTTARPRGRGRLASFAFWIEVAAWACLLLECGAWLMVRQSDRAALPTLFAYGPRWIWLAPPVALLPAGIWRPRLLIPLVAALAIGLGGVLQFEVNPLRGTAAGRPTVTVLTFNADGARVGGALLQIAEEARADILALQERHEDDELPGWTVRCAGRLCTASRYPVTAFEFLDRRLIGGYFAMATIAVVQTPIAPISFVNVHLETVREGIEAVQFGGVGGLPELRGNLFFRDLESKVVTAWIREHAPAVAIIAGDFNQPTDGAIYRRHWREWPDAFETAGRGFGYTKHTSWWGIRIDHVLSAPGWRARSAQVRPGLGSSHRPVVVTLERIAP